ncbi:unnamed protein product [Chondrus crispus]|uniref:Mitochondrial import inner membrane translocase subunit TIM50 n=1 Tax=Chondrus crispus TaxID=2769 RepID=R7Q6D7_CHOCR|nr:unnamed protein product [Chondrus crispus]CDF34102.1 unnamed protein product [Chondrus crispus]|eukprot:XP_005713921.1 unnamed protein product [Chondrus crispus]
MLPASRQYSRSTPLVVTRLIHALSPPTHPVGRGLASLRHLASASIPQAPHPPQQAPSATSWSRRLTQLAAASAVIGGAATYISDPDGTTATVRGAVEAVDAQIKYFAEPSRKKLLPDLEPAFPGGPIPRTLVIDLERTLIYSTYSRASGWRVAKRPGAEAFLAYLASFYEIIVFTSALDSYAEPILNKLDPNGYITDKLYRAETDYKRGVHIKNLDVLNRDLSRVVVIDHDAKQVGLHPQNAIIVPEWTGDSSDTALLDLIPFLEAMVNDDVADVREELKLLSDGDIAAAVAEYRAVAAARADNAAGAGAGTGLFGHAITGMAQQGGAVGAQSEEEDDETRKGGIWGSIGRPGKIFHGSSGGATTKNAN